MDAPWTYSWEEVAEELDVSQEGLTFSQIEDRKKKYGPNQLRTKERKPAFAQVWHVFNMRDKGANLMDNDVTRNRFVWYALGICILLLVLAIYIPGLSTILEMVQPGIQGWLLILGASLIPLIVVQIYKSI